MEQSEIIPSLFTKNEASTAVYRALLGIVLNLENVSVEEKKTCVHLVTGSGAFLGVHPCKNGLRLTIPLARSLHEDRIVKCEQVSARRFHNEVDLQGGCLDPELVQWIAEAHSLKAAVK
jgi:hypothetical protein